MGRKPNPNKQNKLQRVIIRLYRQFDLDLIYLTKTLNERPGYDMQALIKSILRAYMNGKHRPRASSEQIETLLSGHADHTTPIMPRRLQFHLQLDESADADILAWLDKIKLGYRNMCIKGAIRWYLDDVCLYPCLNSTERRFVQARTTNGRNESEDLT